MSENQKTDLMMVRQNVMHSSENFLVEVSIKIYFYLQLQPYFQCL